MDNFINSVARGRGLTSDFIRSAAGGGEAFVARKAKELRLIDEII